MTLRPEQLTESARRLYEDFRTSGLPQEAAVQAALEGLGARGQQAPPFAAAVQAALTEALRRLPSGLPLPAEQEMEHLLAEAFGRVPGGPVRPAAPDQQVLEDALAQAFGRDRMGS